MVPLFIVWVLVRVRILFISSLGPDFIYLESGSGFYRCSPGPNCISDESGSRSRSGFYPLRVRILYWSCSGFYPFLSRVRVRNLSSKSGSMSVSSSGFYPFRVLVRILSSMSGFGSTSGFYQHPTWKPSWSCVDNLNKFPSKHPMEAPYEIRLQTAQCFFRKRSVKMLNLSDLGQRSMNDPDLRLS